MVTLKLPASLMCQSLPSCSRSQNLQAVTVRAHRAAFEDVGRETASFGVMIYHALESRARFFKTEHGNGASRTASGDLCAEQSIGDALGADEIHEQIRSLAAQAALRVSAVRLIHDLTHLRKAHSAAGQLGKQMDAGILLDCVTRASPNAIDHFRAHDRE